MHGLTTQVFWDSDVGKWIEIASYGIRLSARRRPSRRKIEEITDRLAAAQLPDGYLNCWYLGREIENRWTNLRDNHELYNAPGICWRARSPISTRPAAGGCSTS